MLALCNRRGGAMNGQRTGIWDKKVSAFKLPALDTR